MDQLPDLVKSALSAACKSGKSLSWKIQENRKGTLVQLVWKEQVPKSVTVDRAARVSSIWKPGQQNVDQFQPRSNSVGSNEDKPARKTRNCPSRLRRNAMRLQAFLERKQQEVLLSSPATYQKSESQPQSVQSVLKVNADSVDTIVANKVNDLKSQLDEEVDCVDFSVKQGEPGLTLEMNCGDSVWTPVNVKKPTGIALGADTSEFLSAAILDDMDDVVFRSHEVDDSPGFVLKKGSLEVWTPVASRTRSRQKCFDT